MSFVKGRGISVQVGLTYGATKSISAVTQASPGAATSTSHGLADGTVGYISGVTGMVQLEGQAVRVDNPTTNAFDLQGLNTTSYTAFSGTATFTPVSTWATLAECDEYSIGDAAADKIDVTCLIDVIKQEENGNLAAQSLNLRIKSTDTPSAAMAALIAAAQSGTPVVIKITLQNGAVRIARFEPSIPGESVSAGGVGSGNISGSVKGLALMLAA